MIGSFNMQRLGGDNTKVSRKRTPEIDIIKGIAIILMVIGHTKVPGNSFIYLFHMAVFFIASGYTFSDKNCESPTQILHFIWGKIKRLWIPYFCWNCLCLLLNNFLIYLNIYTSDTRALEYVPAQYIKLKTTFSVGNTIEEVLKAFLFTGGSQLMGALWFIQTLFIVLCLYCIISWLVRKVPNQNYRMLIQFAISLLFVTLGYFCYLHNLSIRGLARAWSVYALIHFGYCIRKKHVLEQVTPLLGMATAIILLLILNQYGRIELAVNQFVNPPFLWLASLSGWYLLYYISKFIMKCKYLCEWLCYIGQHSLIIAIGHSFCFKSVNSIIVYTQELPRFCLAAFPVLRDDGYWWIFYTLVGVLIPLGLEYIAQYICNKVSRPEKMRN